MAEAVEVGDAQAGGGRGANALVDPLAQLARRLDAVGQDEQLLGEEVLLGFQQPVDALDDDAGLASSRAGDDHDRAMPMLDDRALRVGKRKLGTGALGGSRRRYGDECSLLTEMMPERVNGDEGSRQVEGLEVARLVAVATDPGVAVERRRQAVGPQRAGADRAMLSGSGRSGPSIRRS